ncbi:MAG: hypothetical protein AAFN40_18040 [Cyanobacteria bacterium J06560_6]
MIQQLSMAVTVTIQRICSAFKALQLQKIVSVAIVGMLLLTTSVDNADLNDSTKAMLNDMIARGENGRPVTSAQWKAENEKLEGEPGKRVKRIAKETGDAVEEMAEIYPGNAKSVLPGMSNDSLERDD